MDELFIPEHGTAMYVQMGTLSYAGQVHAPCARAHITQTDLSQEWKCEVVDYDPQTKTVNVRVTKVR